MNQHDSHWQHHYGKAIRVLEEARRSFPNDSRLRLELGRAYLYSHTAAHLLHSLE